MNELFKTEGVEKLRMPEATVRLLCTSVELSRLLRVEMMPR